MEFSLLKQIVPNRFYFPTGISTNPTHYPGFDCINPGIGNVAQPFSYFVPTFSNSNANVKTKIIPTEVAQNDATFEQDGKGNDEISKDVSSQESVSSQENNLEKESDSEKKILDELNAKKRKLLDSAIYESFVHPKKIKTETLQLNPPKIQKHNLQESTLNQTKKILSSKPIKHKFKFE